MKCSKCGHRSNTLPAMGEHYRKKHPGAMKRHARSPLEKEAREYEEYREKRGPRPMYAPLASNFCPTCGHPLRSR